MLLAIALPIWHILGWGNESMQCRNGAKCWSFTLLLRQKRIMLSN